MKKVNLLFVATFTLLSSVVFGQVKYQNGFLTTGPVTTVPTYINTFFGSTYIKGAGVDAPNNFLQIDIWPAGIRLASHNNVIVLYNTQTSTFNDLQVGNVYNYSDA